MGTFDDYELFEGVYHCLGDTQFPCYTSASASIYVPWSATNAGAIISSIKELSKYFAIYPLTGMQMKQNILLDVTIKANQLRRDFFPNGSSSITKEHSEYGCKTQRVPSMSS